MQISDIENINFNSSGSLRKKRKLKKQFAYLKNILNQLPEEDSYMAKIMQAKQRQQAKNLFSSFFEGILKIFS